MSLIDVGKKAALFELPDQNGNLHRLKDYEGKRVILYFYPRDMTPGCTQEACEFNDSLTSLHKKNTVVLGVSTDSQTKHQKFVEKHKLKFPLLADIHHEVAEKYGVWQEKKLYGKTSMGIVRTTYVIGEDQKVMKRYDKVRVKDHVAKVISELE